MSLPRQSPFLKEPDTEKEIYGEKGTGKFSNVTWALVSMQGWRKTQEDAHCHLFPSTRNPNIGFVGVFDGHAGSKAAKWIAKHIITFIENSKVFKFVDYHKPDPEVLARAAMDGFFECDEGLKLVKEFQNGTEYSGCTGCVAILTQDNMIVSNTGDSRCVLVRAGEPLFATRDHKPDDEREAWRVRQAGGNVIQGRINGDLASARSFGDFRYKKDPKLTASHQMVTVMPDVAIMDRDSQDQFLMIACDGIWDVMSNLECAQFILAAMKLGASAKQCCSLVLDECLRKSSGDNMSIIIVTLNAAPPELGTCSVCPTIEQVRAAMYSEVL